MKTLLFFFLFAAPVCFAFICDEQVEDFNFDIKYLPQGPRHVVAYFDFVANKRAYRLYGPVCVVDCLRLVVYVYRVVDRLEINRNIKKKVIEKLAKLNVIVVRIGYVFFWQFIVLLLLFFLFILRFKCTIIHNITQLIQKVF